VRRCARRSDPSHQRCSPALPSLFAIELNVAALSMDRPT
jgi:hypothetical protein